MGRNKWRLQRLWILCAKIILYDSTIFFLACKADELFIS